MTQYVPYAMIGIGMSLTWFNYSSGKSPWMTVLAVFGVVVWSISAWIDHQNRKIQKQIDEIQKNQR